MRCHFLVESKKHCIDLIKNKLYKPSGHSEDLKDKKNVPIHDKLKLITSGIVYPKISQNEKSAGIWNPWDHKYQTQSNS